MVSDHDNTLLSIHTYPDVRIGWIVSYGDGAKGKI